MTGKTGKTGKPTSPKKKRLPRGFRLYIRRLKQEAKKEGTVYRAPILSRGSQAKAGE